ncbi:hypothetical protein CCACVL1_19128 [Corchorus capsularis]|uniref:Uncharacterized protein n=1 Tax=Corchorus capsularis TaxID=210143 RepID=A0A1R3HIC4_COCAP|nr:hypothetical protein CCACVL1_19128 [Corchorus capsularis]
MVMKYRIYLLLVSGISNIRLLGLSLEINLQVLNNGLALQIPDLDARLGGSAKPVPVRTKAKRVNYRTSIKTCQRMIDLSREEVTIMSELSIGVAMAVTMSVWALMVPRRTNASAPAIFVSLGVWRRSGF